MSQSAQRTSLISVAGGCKQPQQQPSESSGKKVPYCCYTTRCSSPKGEIHTSALGFFWFFTHTHTHTHMSTWLFWFFLSKPQHCPGALNEVQTGYSTFIRSRWLERRRVVPHRSNHVIDPLITARRVQEQRHRRQDITGPSFGSSSHTVPYLPHYLL